jgi:hypothetical protein
VTNCQATDDGEALLERRFCAQERAQRLGLHQHEHGEHRQNADRQDTREREQRLVDAAQPRLDRDPEMQASKLVVGRRHPVDRQRRPRLRSTGDAEFHFAFD